MKRLFVSTPVLLFLILSLSGCNAVGAKSASLTIIYGVAAALSLLLLIGCCRLVSKNKMWVVLLFSSVLMVNIGYTFLAMSTCLEMALWANRLSYLGSVFLPFAMLMIIMNVTGTTHKKWLPWALLTLSIAVFLVAASGGILSIYYKEVYFTVVNGAATLTKVYGPLHPLYLFYLLGYFAAMVAVIVRAQIKKTISSTTHAIILVAAVFVNIGVWLIEQLSSIDFEFLSVSYIISELFLLGIHLVTNENQRLREMVRQIESAKSYQDAETVSDAENHIFSEAVSISPESIEAFMSGLSQLTPTEKSIYDAYISRLTTSEIMARFNIKENTLKYHSRNIYGKLGVCSRKELLQIHKKIKSINAALSTTNSKS